MKWPPPPPKKKKKKKKKRKEVIFVTNKIDNWQILAIETVLCITSHLAIRQLVDLPVMIFYDCKVGCFS